MRIFKEMVIIAITGVALVYLVVPSIVPDFIPLVGWLDEGIATTILLSALNHYGLDLTGLFGKDRVQLGERRAQRQERPNSDLVTVDASTEGQPTRTLRIPRHVLEAALREAEEHERQSARR